MAKVFDENIIAYDTIINKYEEIIETYENIDEDWICELIDFCSDEEIIGILSYNFGPIQSDNLNVVKKILSIINLPNQILKKCIYEAIYWNIEDDLAKILLNKYGDFNGEDLLRGSFLHEAVNAKKNELVKYLLELGSNPNLVCKYGCTPLMYAACDNSSDILILLINYSANIDTIDNDRYSALSCAVELDCFESVKVLLEYNAKIDTVTYNCCSNTEIKQLLIDHENKLVN